MCERAESIWCRAWRKLSLDGGNEPCGAWRVLIEARMVDLWAWLKWRAFLFIPFFYLSPCFESRVISLMWGRQARDGRRISANIWSACEEPIRMFCIRAVLLDGQLHRNETSHDMRLVLFIHIILEVVVLTRTCTAGGGVTYVSHSWLRRQRVVACCVHIRIYIINYMCFCYFNNFNLISYYNYPLSLCIIDHINNKQHIYIQESSIFLFIISIIIGPTLIYI